LESPSPSSGRWYSDATPKGRSTRFGPTPGQRGKVGHVWFNSPLNSAIEITPYSRVYGVHPRFFDFDSLGAMELTAAASNSHASSSPQVIDYGWPMASGMSVRAWSHCDVSEGSDFGVPPELPAPPPRSLTVNCVPPTVVRAPSIGRPATADGVPRRHEGFALSTPMVQPGLSMFGQCLGPSRAVHAGGAPSASSAPNVSVATVLQTAMVPTPTKDRRPWEMQQMAPTRNEHFCVQGVTSRIAVAAPPQPGRPVANSGGDEEQWQEAPGSTNCGLGSLVVRRRSGVSHHAVSRSASNGPQVPEGPTVAARLATAVMDPPAMTCSSIIVPTRRKVGSKGEDPVIPSAVNTPCRRAMFGGA